MDSKLANSRQHSTASFSEDFVAEVTRAAYETALKQGISGSFAELYLNMWHRLQTVFASHSNSQSAEHGGLMAWPTSK